MTMMTETPSPEAIQLRAELAQTQGAACDAIHRLDPAVAIAHCRALRSLLWRAERSGIDLTNAGREPAAMRLTQREHARDEKVTI
jgi:hypothetical protein